MKNKKLVILVLSLSLVLSACGQNKNETGKETNTQESAGETNAKNTQGTLKTISDIKDPENFRDKKDKFMVIDGKEVSYGQFYKFYDLYSSVMSMRQNLSTELVNLFVRDKIVQDELNKEKIEVTDQEIVDEVNSYISNLGGDDKFQEYLSVLGTDAETFKQNIKNTIANRKHIELFKKNNPVKDEELKKYYEENKDSIDSVEAMHILVKDEAKAKEVVEKLKKGEDFKKVSDEYSIDKAAKNKGGQLGKVSKNGYDATFVEAAFKLKENEISEPVKTKFGYHIIKVTKNNVGVDKNKEKISNTLADKAYNDDITAKINKLKIEFYDKNGKVLDTKQQ
ncbi:peptidylprolyl isomerase [Helcococcus kunzii]|uniref:peptidylprolyl isomerase n=1 Tax=Helcococcus kunzii TaxID=40091 RepID=UPI001BB01793|nr:peptidylprolyl isomerase [Helcococcus kunzii]QUY64521.1 hypothetical protein GUI37_02970 [Helcococcus kunzii]